MSSGDGTHCPPSTLALGPARIDSYPYRARDLTLRGRIKPTKFDFWGCAFSSCLIARRLACPAPHGKDMVNSRSATIATLSSSLLVGLERPAAHAILAASRIQRISAKSNISTEGYRATRLFVVQSGRARFYHLTKQGDLVLLAWLVPGDVIGLVTILKSPLRYMATAEAISDCEVLAWEHSVIRNSLPCTRCSQKMPFASLFATCEPSSAAMLDWLPRLHRKGWQRPW